MLRSPIFSILSFFDRNSFGIHNDIMLALYLIKSLDFQFNSLTIDILPEIWFGIHNDTLRSLYLINQLDVHCILVITSFLLDTWSEVHNDMLRSHNRITIIRYPLYFCIKSFCPGNLIWGTQRYVEPSLMYKSLHVLFTRGNPFSNCFLDLRSHLRYTTMCRARF